MSSSSSKFSGVHSALVTPFTKNGDIDFAAFSDLVALQKMDGIHGVLLAGTTGEGPTLSLSEREALVVSAKKSDLVVMAYAGSNDTKCAIEGQKAMENAGADATVQVVPYYNKPTQQGLFEHFCAIAKVAKIPIIMYNAAGRTGIDLAPSTMSAIMKEHDNIIGVKDANADVERLSDLMRLTKSIKPNFLVLAGEDSSFFSYLTHGGDGIISVVSQIATSEMLALYQSIKNADIAAAQQMAQRLNGLCKLLFSHTNPIPIKTLLADMGLIQKHWRLPLCALRHDEESQFLHQCREFSFVKNFAARGFTL